MNKQATKNKGLFGEYKDIGKTVYHDLQRGGFRHGVSRDLRSLYEFYVDEDTRAGLAEKSRFRRWLLQIGWLLRSAILSLSPIRRALLVLGLLAFVIGIDNNDGARDTGWLVVSLATVTLVLLLELKDKLIARDELEVGREIQLSLLPSDNPTLKGWDIWLHTQAANDVGGDLVDYIRFPVDRLGIVLGDVSGKGLGAALLMAKLQATLRAVVYEGMPLAELGSSTNRIMCRDGIVGKFATLVYLDLGPGESRVRILNAGHMPPLVVRREGIGTLEPRSLPVGVEPTETYEEQSLDLRPDELLVVYSDGVTEARNVTGEFFGDARLLELLPQTYGLPVEAAGGHVLGAVQAFVGQERLPDDLSVVLVRRRV